jgi:hypothetical protein
MPRFHILRPDGLYGPIRFLFVTDTMCREIVTERDAILASLPESARKRQSALFERYDPQVSAHAFKALLGIFRFPTPRAPDVAIDKPASPAARPPQDMLHKLVASNDALPHKRSLKNA